MRTAITAILFALVASFATPAAAAMPCNGSSSNCTWTCDTDGEGNITQYNVTCPYSDYCVDGETNDWNFGPCQDVAPPPSDPFDQIFAVEALLLEVAKTCGDYLGK